MPGGTHPSGYADIWQLTGPAIASGPDEILNDAQKRTYTIKHFLKGRKFQEIVQSGQRIQDFLRLTDKATAETYLPGQTATPTQPQTISRVYANWRYVRDHKAWQDEIMKIQSGGASAKQRVQIFKREVKNIDDALNTSLMNKLDDLVWQNPHGAAMATQMESENGTQPYSIPALLTENSTDGHPFGWSTVHGQDPGTEPNWIPPVTRYNVQDPLDTQGLFAGLFDAFEMMAMKLAYEKPGRYDQSFYENRPTDCVIFCSEKGKLQYQSLCRQSNDSLRLANDPSYPMVNFHGVEIQQVQALNTATLYLHSTSTAVAEDDSNLTLGGTWSTTNWTRGPRYWFVNPNIFKMWFHPDMFFNDSENMSHVNQPWSYAMYRRVVWNFLCRSRLRGGGVVGPGGTQNAA